MSITKEQQEILDFIVEVYNKTPLVAKGFIKNKFNEIPSALHTLPNSVKSCTVEYMLKMIDWAYRSGYLS